MACLFGRSIGIGVRRFAPVYDNLGGPLNFTELQSISDGTSTDYLLTGSGMNVYPAWVDSVQYPTWANITYGPPQSIIYNRGTCSTGGSGCGIVVWAANTFTAFYSTIPINQSENFLFIEDTIVVPEPSTFILTGFIFLRLAAASGASGATLSVSPKRRAVTILRTPGPYVDSDAVWM
jgi:hypothetical protein